MKSIMGLIVNPVAGMGGSVGLKGTDGEVEKAQVRRAYHIEGKSIRQIQGETGHHRETIRKALEDSSVPQYTLKRSRPSPVLDPV